MGEGYNGSRHVPLRLLPVLPAWFTHHLTPILTLFLSVRVCVRVYLQTARAGGFGAFMMDDPAQVEEMIRACVDAVSVPVSAKIRCVWSPYFSLFCVRFLSVCLPVCLSRTHPLSASWCLSPTPTH